MKAQTKKLQVNGLEEMLNTTNQVVKNNTKKVVENTTEENEDFNFAVDNLDNLNPADYYNQPRYRSSKFEGPEREQKIQRGIKFAKELGIEINPLLNKLATWWEVKPARAEIKKAIDAEADAKGALRNDYLQTTLRAEVEKLDSLISMVERMKYAITFFKPRMNSKAKGKLLTVKIDGEVILIYEKVLTNIKMEFANDKVAMKQAILDNQVKENIIEL